MTPPDGDSQRLLSSALCPMHFFPLLILLCILLLEAKLDAEMLNPVRPNDSPVDPGAGHRDS